MLGLRKISRCRDLEKFCKVGTLKIFCDIRFARAGASTGDLRFARADAPTVTRGSPGPARGQ